MAVPLTLSSVPAQTPYVQYIATAGQTVFPYPFEITQDSDLIVVLNGTTQPTDSGYTLSGQGATGGGNVTFTAGLALGTIVTLYRNITIARITQLAQNGTFFSANFNNEYNRIYLILQQLYQNAQFNLSIPNTNNPNGNTILTPAAYANKALLFDANGNPTPGVLTSSALSAAIIGSFVSPTTTAETNVGVTPTNIQYPTGNALRYGIVPNSSGAAGANTAAWQALVSESAHTSGWTGRFTFPNTTGADVYWFNDIIDFRDNIQVDLNGCTLQFTKGSTSAHDTTAGFIMAQRNFLIENGTINVNYTGGANMGAVLAFGARGSDAGGGAFYPNSYDSTLSAPQGNIIARNLVLTTNNPAGLIAQLTGGLENVLIQNVQSDGGSVSDGWDYEFGWATSGTTNLRQTSHAKNLMFENVTVTNTTGGTGTALTITGAYNCAVNGLYTNNCVMVLTEGPGESLNYRPWVSNDDVGCKRTKHFQNIVGESVTGAGIQLQGSGLAAEGYLSAVVANPPLTAAQLIAAQVHLNDFVLDGFALQGAGGNTSTGVTNSGHICKIRNGKVKGFQIGITSYDDAENIEIDGCHVEGNTRTGINLAAGNSVVLAGTPTYTKKPVVRNCIVLGNSTSSTNTYPGIAIANSDSGIFENNRVNSEVAFPGEANETTQGNAFQLSASAVNNVFRYNRVGTVLGGSFAYFFITNAPTSPASNNVIEGATGTVTNSGVWDGIEQAWTPVLTCATIGDLSVVYSVQAGGYTKRGNIVDFWCSITTSTFTYTTSSGNWEITGLPYLATTVTNKNSMCACAQGGYTKASYSQISAAIASGTQFIQFYASGSGQTLAHLVAADLPSGTQQTFLVSGRYFV